MKYLFVHQNFPGQFLHIVRHLLEQQRHDVVFICEPNRNVMPGVRRITYRPPVIADDTMPGEARDFATAMARADSVAEAGRRVRDLGFTPDIIIGHHGWGELLNLQDVWPDVPLLGYHEYYYALHGQDVGFDPEFRVGVESFSHIRAKNAVNLLALTNPGTGQTPTQFQLDTYPEWARPNIHLLREGVHLDKCFPVPAFAKTSGRRATTVGGIPVAGRERLVTYVARDLEPYRGFHVLMRSLPALLRNRPDARVIIVGGDGVSYGSRLSTGNWREHMLAELGKSLDTSRVHFPGKLDYDSYVHLLQRSDAHVYMTYPFVASWSLREALASGCAIVASDTAPVHEFVIHGKTGMLTPFHDPGALADRIAEMLEGGPKVDRMRRNARAWAETHLSMDDYLARYEALIAKLTGQKGGAKAPRRQSARLRSSAGR
jgi:glycosyltransferase involved in cell wall biosynthesis